MNIWVDLANSPQVLFFRPILKEIEARGHRLLITARSYAQTTQLASQYGLKFVTIGKHGGNSQVGVLAQISLRSFSLARWAKNLPIDLCVSHNSYSQVMAAKLLRIPAVTLMDYEHQPLNHLCFRLAKRVIVPEPFPDDLLRKYGASHKSIKYPGIKEQVYLYDFVPNPNFLIEAGFPREQNLVVVRPPATWAAYHRFKNELFDQLLAYLNSLDHSYVLFLPRIPAQIESVIALSCIHVASKVYDGPNLLFYADAVISGGGTMNREAAVLGTPTYSIFKGNIGAVDRYLVERNRMALINDVSDFPAIINAKNEKLPRMENPNIMKQIVDEILNTA